MKTYLSKNLQSLACFIFLMLPPLSVQADTSVMGKIIGMSLEQGIVRVQPDAKKSKDDGLNIIVDNDSTVLGKVQQLKDVNVGATVSVSYYSAMKFNSRGIARGSFVVGGVVMAGPMYYARELNIIDNNNKWWKFW